MQTFFVRVECDVTAKVHEQPFRYRAYINNELFAERTWIWKNHYLEEMLQIAAEPGEYHVRLEAVKPWGGKFKASNVRVEYGDARWRDNNILEILP